ncbi:MAG: AbrB/MazE/SpoVT family DNA-binding domain-containing protein [Acidimicrobiales bacterium]
MDAAAQVTSKGQVTVPKVVRGALGIKQGDQVILRVGGNRVVVAETVYVLESFYEAPRPRISEAIRSLVALESILTSVDAACCCGPSRYTRRVEPPGH